MKKKNKWGRREQMIAENLGLKRVPYSGAGLFDKEDLVGNGVRGQLKSTEGESIRIQKEDVYKMLENTKREEKGFFALDFVDGPFLLCATKEDFLEVAKRLFENDESTSIDVEELI